MVDRRRIFNLLDDLETRLQHLVNRTVERTVNIPPSHCACLETVDAPLCATVFHEFLRILISINLIFQIAFVAHKDDRNLLSVQYLLVPVLCIVETDLSR